MLCPRLVPRLGSSGQKFRVASRAAPPVLAAPMVSNADEAAALVPGLLGPAPLPLRSLDPFPTQINHLFGSCNLGVSRHDGVGTLQREVAAPPAEAGQPLKFRCELFNFLLLCGELPVVRGVDAVGVGERVR